MELKLSGPEYHINSLYLVRNVKPMVQTFKEEGYRNPQMYISEMNVVSFFHSEHREFEHNRTAQKD